MRSIDSMKAALVGLGALALNLALTTAVIFAYAGLIHPGRPEAAYKAAAPHIADGSAPLIGAVLLPQRRAIPFAVAIGAAYVVLDAVSGAASAGTGAIVSPVFAFSMGLALAGAVAGGVLAARRNR